MTVSGDDGSLASYAAAMDAADSLATFRQRFLFPHIDGKPLLYFCGNSLGLEPITTRQAVLQELEDWATWGVEGHFRARNPWYFYHKQFAEPLAALVGALPHEVVCMNTLTVNLHLMLTTFYQPKGPRTRIIVAGYEFPSDRYAVESQVRLHGLDPAATVVEVQPHVGTQTLSTEQIVATIREHGEHVALVMFSGVHFYTGQFFDLQAIAAAANEVGAYVGFDLAHAVGNVELHLHDWGADFAVWCSYKYLNSGPGGVGGAFVHERHANKPDLLRPSGWWGNDEATRFTMEHGFSPSFGADGWQLSNAQVLPMAAHKASLDIFMEAGMQALSAKREALTGLLERMINEVAMRHSQIRIITPSNPAERGAQLSVAFTERGKEVFDALHAQGIVVDWRVPNVIRIAPVPLYNTFDEVYRFGMAFDEICRKVYA